MIVERTIKITKEEEKAIKTTLKIIKDIAYELEVDRDEVFNEFYEMGIDINFNGEYFGVYDDYEIKVEE